jgi:hypothetical protein
MMVSVMTQEKTLQSIDNAAQSVLFAIGAFFVWFHVNLDGLTGGLLFFCAGVKLYTSIKEAMRK